MNSRRGLQETYYKGNVVTFIFEVKKKCQLIDFQALDIPYVQRIYFNQAPYK